MFVTKSKYNRDLGELRRKNVDLQLLIDNVNATELRKAQRRVEKMRESEITLANTEMEFEETPNPILNDEPDKKPLPSRKEYDDRVNAAIEKFRAGKNVSQVMVELHVAKKTARRYLKIALAKRKVKKADFDELNV